MRDQPGYDDAVNAANLSLSLDALRRGDVRESVRFMNEAAKTPPAARDPRLESRVVAYLLNVGERESVAAYLDRVAAASADAKDRKLADAAAIRRGVMPESYQVIFGG